MRELQHYHHQPPTVVAILGTHTLSEDILARLLEHEGYHVRHLEAPPTGLMDELHEGVDVLLLAPVLHTEVREGFLAAMSSTHETAAIAVLAFSSALQGALLDALSASGSWGALFEELLGQIGATLSRAAASAGALVAERCSAEPPAAAPPAAQADGAL